MVPLLKGLSSIIWVFIETIIYLIQARGILTPPGAFILEPSGESIS
jgi:hypothetical protein